MFSQPSPGSSIDFMFCDAFQLQLESKHIKLLFSLLTELLDEHVHIMDHITLETTCDEGANTSHLTSATLLWTPYHYIISLLGGQPSMP